jgi:hypothetical protein
MASAAAERKYLTEGTLRLMLQQARNIVLGFSPSTMDVLRATPLSLRWNGRA